MTSMTNEAAKDTGAKPRDAERSKNFFALGLISWMYSRPAESDDRLDREALRQPRSVVRDANLAAFKAGWNFGETAELFDHRLRDRARPPAPGQVPQHHRQHRPSPTA